MADPLTPAAIRADVARMLHRAPDDDLDEDLFECGLDSVRLLTLLERWREAGADVGFVELAQRPTLENWLLLLTSRVSATPHA